MTNNEIDLELRKIYKNILIALLSIEKFDYFEKNADIKKIIAVTLQDESIYEVNEKSKILSYIKDFDFNSISDRDLFYRVKYKQRENIYNIFKKQFSLYTGLTVQDKKNIIFLDFCQNSMLESVFYNNDIPFSLSDFYKVYEFVFSSKRHYNLKATMKKVEHSGLIKKEESLELLCINQKLHANELNRLAYMPFLERFELSDYTTTERKAKSLLSDQRVTVFTGECKSSYLFSRLEKEMVRFYYAHDFYECKQILNYFKANKLKNECIWLDNFEPEVDPLDEKELLFKANRVKAKLIISGSHLEFIKPFGKKCTIISLKDRCLENLVKKQFPGLLAKEINLYIKKIRSSESKRRFIFEIKDLLRDTDPEFISKGLCEYFNVFQRCENELQKASFAAKEKKKTEKKASNIITALDKSDFEKRYGDIFDELSNPNLSAEDSKIINIYKKLSAPAIYLTANKNMLNQFDTLLEQYPNIFPEDKELIRSFFKNSVILSKDNIIDLPNLLLVGPAGCGKTRFVREFTALIGQKRDCFIACGTGNGQDEIVGSDATYKNAAPGKILTSIYNSMDDNINCLNSLIVFDEIDKSKWTPTGDSNQDLYGTMLLILGEENLKFGYKDNFLDIRIPLLKPNFVLTANSIDPIPEPILDRVQIIRFRDYNVEEIQKIVIPSQYQEFQNKHNRDLLPTSLNQTEIKIISQMSEGKPRKIQTSLNKYFAILYDNDGVKHDLNAHELDYLLEHSINNSQARRIGFCN